MSGLTISVPMESERTVTGMAEYIDREAAIKMLRGIAIAKYPSSFALGIFAAANELKNLQSADVAPVRNWRWLTWEEQFPGEKPRRSNNLGVFCDKCHNHADNRTDFCPNCGAKMDGGIDNG